MAVMEIRTYGDPILRKNAETVTEFNDELRQIFNDMLETMYVKNGIGLAANQVGLDKRILVCDSGTREKPEVYKLANPEITESSKEKTVFEEGCLSFPGLTEKITRPAAITVKAKDENGKDITIKATGLKATVLQHEIDHINGRVFIDRMTPVKKMLHNKELKEIKKLREKK